MSKIVKYINYVVEDLIKKTTIDDTHIRLPFGEDIKMGAYKLYYYGPYHHLPNLFKFTISDNYLNYGMRRYGVKEVEWRIIYENYINEIISMVSGDW